MTEDAGAPYATVESADGTAIGYARIGHGPVPLVVVHGALSAGSQWVPVAEALGDACTCHVVDRWGRGGSGEHPAYGVEREVDDVLAVLDIAGPDAVLMGHSSGAIYALEAALRRRLAGLILYEPPIHGFHGRFVREIWGRIRAAADRGDYEAVVSIFLTEEAELPPGLLSAIRERPLWQLQVAMAPNSVREWEALVRQAPTVDRYRDVAAPTLLLGGAETGAHPSFATRALAAALPDARVSLLEGQGHAAHMTAPHRLAAEIGAFVGH
ncbi:MAG TPA: alpha/beta hydrolase [Longimicrobiales bacterium]|nr:alpha/beta hydrolase [Longimicrobiales bacterium]